MDSFHCFPSISIFMYKELSLFILLQLSTVGNRVLYSMACRLLEEMLNSRWKHCYEHWLFVQMDLGFKPGPPLINCSNLGKFLKFQLIWYIIKLRIIISMSQDYCKSKLDNTQKGLAFTRERALWVNGNIFHWLVSFFSPSPSPISQLSPSSFLFLLLA